jgi:hypothetical protein
MSQRLASLPSLDAAVRFMRGEEGGLGGVITSTALRAVLIGAGLAVVGERKHLVKYSLAGAVAIEAFVLLTVRAQLATKGDA